MEKFHICVEPFERRMLLSAAIEVWAGNADLRGGDEFSTFLNIDQSSYTKIGESNAANSAVAFSSAGNYKYFVIATRGRVEVDAIRNSAGTYIAGVNRMANVGNPGAATGAPNGAFAAVGTGTTDQSFAGYMLIVAPTTWQGITLTTGSVEPMFRFSVDFDRLYIAGNQTSYGVSTDMYVNHNGMVEAARVHTPAGRWVELIDDEEDYLSHEQFYTSPQAADSELGDGTYILWMQTSAGERTYELDGTGVSYPTQIPFTSSLVHGGTNAPTTFDPVLPTITDPNVDSVSLEIDDRTEDQVYSNYTNAGGTLPTVYLNAAESYVADLDFSGGTWFSNDFGQEFGYTKSNETGYVFATGGFTQQTPDLFASSFIAAPQSVNPGEVVMIDVTVGTSGGMVYSPTQPVRHVIGLSRNMVIGDGDDVILFAPIEAGHPKDWSSGGEFGIQVPVTALPGQYYLFGKMDAANAVAETNESNNVAWSSQAVITVLPQAITFDPGTQVLSIAGTASADSISVTLDNLTLLASINGVTRSFAKTDVVGVYIGGDAGNDTVLVGNGLPPVTIRGGDGDDTLTGGNGNDLIFGDGGNDSMAGNDGMDTIYGNFGDDVIAGGLTRDSLLGGLGNDVITAGDGPDSVYGGDGTDVLRGGKGGDWIEGRGKSDTIYGGLSNDQLFGGAGADAIYGEDGDDRIDVSPASVFHDTIDGGLGMDLGLYDADDTVLGIEGLLA